MKPSNRTRLRDRIAHGARSNSSFYLMPKKIVVNRASGLRLDEPKEKIPNVAVKQPLAQGLLPRR
jgi:hypothetical protein